MYSFGHLKSARSSETVDFEEKNVSYQKNANSKNARVSRLRREKFQKESSNVGVQPNE